MRRGNCNNYYDGLVYLNQLLAESDVNYKMSWYMESSVFSNIHDVSSIVTSPDYKVHKIPDGFNKSVDILIEMLEQYSTDQGIKRISKKKHRCVVEWFITYLYQGRRW
jgi:hypothetical protein